MRLIKFKSSSFPPIQHGNVCRDLEENHHRKIAHSYLQDVSDWVGGIAQVKEEVWEYAIPLGMHIK